MSEAEITLIFLGAWLFWLFGSGCICVLTFRRTTGKFTPLQRKEAGKAIAFATIIFALGFVPAIAYVLLARDK